MNLPAIIQSPIDVVRALFGSMFGVDVAYYPRKADGGANLSPEDMLKGIQDSFGGFAFSPDELIKSADPKLLLDRAKDSLDEARKQTEYQDAKAGRLLTIVAFLTAAIATVFGKFIDLYPLHSGQASVRDAAPWVMITYGLFGLYLLLVAAGALVTFHAMSTRFVWLGGKDQADKPEVGSVLFFKQVIRTRPESWGELFAGDRGELLRTYYKNYVTEAYLISAKVADKLRYLDPGQRLLLWSIRILLGLFCSLIMTFVIVAPPPKANAETVGSGVAATSPPQALPDSCASISTATLQLPEKQIAESQTVTKSPQRTKTGAGSTSNPTPKNSVEKN